MSLLDTVLIVWNLTQNGRKVATNDKRLMLQFGRVALTLLAAWAGNGQLLSKNLPEVINSGLCRGVGRVG